MTTRTEYLWGIALDRAMPDTYSSLSWTQIQKVKSVFAQLILQDCADYIDQNISTGGVDGAGLKEHFESTQ